MNIGPLVPNIIDKSLVISKLNYFVDVQLWPRQSDVNPNLWLENFHSSEIEYALSLLNSFLYFTEELVNHLFVAAFQTLSNIIRTREEPFRFAQGSWRSFVNKCVITPVVGETPSITDSGMGFARRARKLLDIDQERILDHSGVIQLILASGPRPVIFVDDFVGSGQQFITTWNRKNIVKGADTLSFMNIASIREMQFFYIPLLCTNYGYNRIKQKCPEVIVNPTHIISERYSVFSEKSIIWPDHLRNSATDVIKKASQRAGIPDTDGGEKDWRGFHKLGLTLAIHDTIPDATLPIFYWEKNGWKPLIRRK